VVFFFSSRRRHTRCYRDWSSDVCSSDLIRIASTPQTIDAVSPVPLFATRVGEAFILSLQPAVRRLSRWPEVPNGPRQSSRISGRLVLPFGTPSSRCLATLSQARSRRCWPWRPIFQRLGAVASLHTPQDLWLANSYSRRRRCLVPAATMLPR